MKRLLNFMPSLVLLLSPGLVFAHVIVTPGQAGIGQELVFSVSVPNERQTSVTNVKLLIPSGITDVIPTVLPGWDITTSSNNNPTNPEVTSINWAGSIPVGERDDFSFSAQVPGSPTELDWKAYQTYGDDTIVHWDQKPAGSDDSTGNAGPYSVTHVVNDLNSSTNNSSGGSNTTLALVLSLVAIVFSASSLFIRKNK